MIYMQLYLSFLQIGFTSFGGLSMISVINQQMGLHGWMTVSEVADIIAIAEMTPGPLGINCATFAGLRVACFPGALAAMLGVLTPTFTLCLVIGIFFQRFKQSNMMQKALYGIRPACIGLTFGAITSLTLSNYVVDSEISLPAVLIGLIGFLLYYSKKINVPLLLLISGVGALLFL